jgi:hypothetical protein
MDIAWKIGIPLGLGWLFVSAIYRVAQDQNWPIWVYIAAPLGALAVYFAILLPSMPNRPGSGGARVEVFPDRSGSGVSPGAEEVSDA